jgi:hypothetical protein
MVLTRTSQSDQAELSSARSNHAGRQHFLWQEHIAASGLRPAVKLVAWRVALFRNVKNGRCDPSYAAIASGTGVSKRSAIRAIATLEKAGWLIVDRGNGRGKSNQFHLTIPAERVTLESRFPTQKGDNTTAERVTSEIKKSDRPRQKKVTELCHPNIKENKKEQEGERERAQGRAAPPPVFPDDENSTIGPPGLQKEEISEAFAELVAVWARPWPDDVERDRRAFELACQEVAPEDILAGAVMWADAIGPRYRPVLWKCATDLCCGNGWKRGARNSSRLSANSSTGGAGGTAATAANPISRALHSCRTASSKPPTVRWCGEVSNEHLRQAQGGGECTDEIRASSSRLYGL